MSVVPLACWWVGIVDWLWASVGFTPTSSGFEVIFLGVGWVVGRCDCCLLALIAWFQTPLPLVFMFPLYFGGWNIKLVA